MPTPSEVLSDPNFQGLPLGEQLKVMQQVDPSFAGLSAKDQGTVIAKSRQKSLGTDKIGEKPKDAGFGRTLVSDVAGIPGALMATGTGEKGDTRPPGIIPKIGTAQHEQFQKGREDFKQGNYVSGAGHTLAGAVPVLGPLAATAGEEIGSGQYGQAAAHSAELFTPYLKDVPAGKIVKAGAKAVSETFPDLHPIAKAAIKRVPGGGMAMDLADWAKRLSNRKPAASPVPAPPITKWHSQAEGALPEPKTGVDASKRPMPGKPPAETSGAMEEVGAKAIGKLLRNAKIRPEDAGKITEDEWPMIAKQAGVKPPSPKAIRAALEENRKLWAASQGDLQARRAAHFAKQNQNP